MEKGYEVIEPVLLDPVMVRPKCREFAVALLCWLVQEIRLELGERLGGATLSVIRVEYLGAYPALGIRHADVTSERLGVLVEQVADRLLKEKNISEFVSFLTKGDVDWRALTARIMTEGE